METVMINGQAFGYADVKLQMLGVLVTGWTELSYKKMKEKVNNYTSGAKPSSRGYGQETYEGSITLEKKEVERITAAIKGGSILDIAPFTIVLSYLNSANVPVTHKLRYVEFTENGREIKTGDSNILVKLPLIIGGIDGL